MKEDDLSRTVLTSFLWRFMERSGAKIVQLVVELILARILVPSVYGIVALVTVFTTILNVFIDSGMANALIQKKDADELDFSSVFFFNMFICMVLYGLVFFIAPLIASFYKMMDLVPIIRVLSLSLIISGVKNVQQAFVSRNMLFKKFFFATLGGTIGAAVVGIFMAYNGFGVWALVAQNLFNSTLDTIILWITVKWRPKFEFSFQRLKALFSYGWKLLVSALIDAIYTNIRQLIIGKLYLPSDLAFYNKGEQFPYIIVSNINISIDSVLFPAMSRNQDEHIRLKTMTRSAIKTSTYVMAPLMIGIAICAEPLVTLLLTEKWLPCVPFLRVFCITYVFYPIHTANLNAIKALGRSDMFLKLEIIKKSIGFVVLLSTMWFGVKIMAYSFLLTSMINQIINSWPNKKLLNYPFHEQLKDIIPGFLIAIGMGMAVYGIQFFNMPILLTLLIQIITGVVIYVGCSVLLHVDSFYYLLTLLKRFKDGKS